MSSAAANATPTSPLFNWLGTRAAGVLLHPTALPGDQGIGTFDEHAVRFLDFLQAAGLKYWQLCPLGRATAIRLISLFRRLPVIPT